MSDFSAISQELDKAAWPIDTGPMRRMVCLFTSQRHTTCRGSQSNVETGNWTRDLQSQRPDLSTSPSHWVDITLLNIESLSEEEDNWLPWHISWRSSVRLALECSPVRCNLMKKAINLYVVFYEKHLPYIIRYTVNESRLINMRLR